MLTKSKSIQEFSQTQKKSEKKNYFFQKMQTPETQGELYSKIVAMAKQYNENQRIVNPNDPKRIIVEKHSRTCRCQTCWYKFGGEDDVEYANTTPNSIEVDVYNSNRGLYREH